MQNQPSLLITSSDGDVYRVARSYLVDAYIGKDTITIASIKGTRTIAIKPDERARLIKKLQEWEFDDDYAAA